MGGRNKRINCPVCNKEMWQQSLKHHMKAKHGIQPEPKQPEEPKLCLTCGEDLATHWRCKGCKCLGHLLPRSKTNRRYCERCANERARR